MKEGIPLRPQNARQEIAQHHTRITQRVDEARSLEDLEILLLQRRREVLVVVDRLGALIVGEGGDGLPGLALVDCEELLGNPVVVPVEHNHDL